MRAPVCTGADASWSWSTPGRHRDPRQQVVRACRRPCQQRAVVLCIRVRGPTLFQHRTHETRTGEPMRQALTVLTIILAACTDPAPAPEPCTTRADCTDPQECVDSVCVRVPCTTAAECRTGLVCVGGICANPPDAGGCRASGCPQVGYRCVYDRCVPGCVVASDCCAFECDMGGCIQDWTCM